MPNRTVSKGDEVIYCDLGHDLKSVGSLEKVEPKHFGKVEKTTATFVRIKGKKEPIRYSHIYKKFEAKNIAVDESILEKKRKLEKEVVKQAIDLCKYLI